MRSWKTVPFALLALAGNEVAAAENNNPFQAALMITTLIPSVTVAGAMASTSNAPDLFKSAKGDALAFIGSDGKIRGAQFEQASRHYRETSTSPLMTDLQLAKSIVASY